MLYIVVNTKKYLVDIHSYVRYILSVFFKLKLTYFLVQSRVQNKVFFDFLIPEKILTVFLYFRHFKNTHCMLRICFYSLSIAPYTQSIYRIEYEFIIVFFTMNCIAILLCVYMRKLYLNL